MKKQEDSDRICGLPPLIGKSARVLILGSIPGKASLQAGEYYAHPRNVFWPIMGALFDAGREKPYWQRVECLLEHGIAVWNIYDSCLRSGSLDADIREATHTALEEILEVHPITTVALNGQGLQSLVRRHPAFRHRSVDILVLPSTSPAFASLDFAQKLSAWRVLKSRL